MKAGFFASKITPSIGVESPGSYGKCYVSSIEADLFATAVVFDNGEKTIALVGVDTAFVDETAVRKIQELVMQKCPIPLENIIIGASHTHSGGAVCGMNGLYDNLPEGAPDIIKKLVSESLCPDPAYRKYFIKQTADTIIKAWKKRGEVKLSVDSAHEDTYVFNRRYKMKYGRVVTNPGRFNLNIDEPAGPTDPEVGVLGIWRDDNTLLGCVVNYACHGTCGGNGGVHPDWIRFLRETIEKHYPGSKTVFLNGASGDINHINPQWERRDSGEAASRRVGTAVGAAVLKVLADTDKADYNQLAAKCEQLIIPRRKPSQKKLAEALKIIEENSDKTDGDWMFARERVIYDYLYKQESSIAVPISLLQIGPALYAANPAELFCELGLRLKNSINLSPTWVVALANGHVGYVPTKESFAADGGGYETILTSYANLDINAGNMIVEKTLKIAQNFESVQIISGDTTASHPNGWRFGLRGPDID